jgi:transcriptional regulator with XRE-family HTH domain
MEDQHMSQQVFADFLGQSPATLSSIFNGRTRPTLNVVDAINAKIPNISIEWLLYGKGEMYTTPAQVASGAVEAPPKSPQEAILNFDEGAYQPGVVRHSQIPAGSSQAQAVRPASVGGAFLGMDSGKMVQERPREEVHVVERPPRRVTEIRVYYDDHTYETFLPADGQKKA